MTHCDLGPQGSGASGGGGLSGFPMCSRLCPLAERCCVEPTPEEWGVCSTSCVDPSARELCLPHTQVLNHVPQCGLDGYTPAQLLCLHWTGFGAESVAAKSLFPACHPGAFPHFQAHLVHFLSQPPANSSRLVNCAHSRNFIATHYMRISCRRETCEECPSPV